MTEYVCHGCKDKSCYIAVREGRGIHSHPPDIVRDKKCVYSVNEKNRAVLWGIEK